MKKYPIKCRFYHKGGKLTYRGNSVEECVIKALLYWRYSGGFTSFTVIEPSETNKFGKFGQHYKMQDYVRSLYGGQ